MHAFRYVTALMLGSVLSICLFVLMQRMLTFDQMAVRTSESVPGIDFVRLIRAPRVLQKKTVTPIPKKPPPPKKKKPPPKVEALQLKAPKIQKIALPKPRFQSKINLNDALFLGDFHKAPTVKASAPVASLGQGLQADEEVVPLVRIAPTYPRRAARLGLEGWVELEVSINAQGTVDSARVLDAFPQRTFNAAAIRAIKRWRFRPKIVNGRAVPRKAMQMMKFKLR